MYIAHFEWVIDVELREDFFDEEIISNYRITREMKQVWAVNLDLLDVFQELCNEYELKYFAGFGTLLGAVRHQGFIPWDDDIDILMPRDDFEKFKRLASVVKSPYYIQTAENEKGFWHRGMMKFRRSDTTCIEKHSFYSEFNQGIGLEILPLDNCPDVEGQRRSLFKKIGCYQKLLWAKFFNTDCTDKCSTIEWSFYCFAAKFYTKSFLKNKLGGLCQSYNDIDTSLYAIYTSYNCETEYKIFHKEDFDSNFLFEFETITVPVPKGFRRCLEIQYGKNFLTYLPELARVPHHPALWDAEESYLLYSKRFKDVFRNTSQKKIVLFGSGNMVSHYLNSVASKFMPVFCVDNNNQKWGKMIENLPIKSPAVLKKIPKNQLHIIICNNYFREIGKQLRDMGLDDYYIYTDNYDGLFSTPNEIGIFDMRKKKYVLGYYVIEEIHELSSNVLADIQLAQSQCARLVIGINYVSSDGNEILTNIEYKRMKKMLETIKYVDHVVKIDAYDLESAQKKYLFDRLFVVGKFRKSALVLDIDFHIINM